MSVAKIILDGVILSVIASLFILVTLRINSRIWLHDYPQDIQARVHPKTERERRLSSILGVLFLILLFAVPFVSTLALKSQNSGEISWFLLAVNAFGVVFVFNLVDWLVLDWLMFCAITPSFVVIPGSEDAKAYKDYWFHFRGFLKGTVISAVAGLVIGIIAFYV